MFVRSRLEKDIVYRKKGKNWTIKAGTVTYIDEAQVTAQELRKLYSTRIEIMSRERLEVMEKEIPVRKEFNVVKESDFEKNYVGVRSIDELLAEIKEEQHGRAEVNISPSVTKEGNVTTTIVPRVDSIILEPEQVAVDQPVEVKNEKLKTETVDPVKETFITGVGSEESVRASADLKIELDATQPVEVKEDKKEKLGIEDKPKRGRKGSNTIKKPSSNRRGRKKSTAK